MADRIKVTTFNVRAFPAMAQKRVRQDIVSAKKQDADFYAWQEFWLKRYRTSLRNVFAGTRWGNFAPDGPLANAGTCLTYKRSRMDYQSSGQFKMHGAVAFVCSHRYARYVRAKDSLTGKRITFISAHPTPSAFSNRLSVKRKRKARAAWEQGMKRLRSFAASEARAGRTVVIGMDANAKPWEINRVFGNECGGKPVRIRTSPATHIDHVVIIGNVQLLDYYTGKGQNSDHPAYMVTFRIRK